LKVKKTIWLLVQPNDSYSAFADIYETKEEAKYSRKDAVSSGDRSAEYWTIQKETIEIDIPDRESKPGVYNSYCNMLVSDIP
jgi:hypothetical protein